MVDNVDVVESDDVVESVDVVVVVMLWIVTPYSFNTTHLVEVLIKISASPSVSNVAVSPAPLVPTTCVNVNLTGKCSVTFSNSIIKSCPGLIGAARVIV